MPTVAAHRARPGTEPSAPRMMIGYYAVLAIPMLLVVPFTIAAGILIGLASGPDPAPE